jgi:acetyl-CoA synthetase
VGKGQAVIVDTWWQTETGGFLCSTMPALQPMKPGSAGPAVPGIHPVIYDENGNEIPAGSGKAGNICIQNPWPGAFQTIWGDRQRFVSTYYAKYCTNPNSKDWRDWPYFTGDGAMQAAVVPVADDLRGRVPDMYVSLKPGVASGKAVEQKVMHAIETIIGPIARPKHVYIVSDMPKTRSGKIMRRVLASISNTMNIGDVTTLANPEVVEEIRKMVQGEGVVVTKEGPEDLKNFGEER